MVDYVSTGREFGSKGSGCSLPFRFSRISTLPSACSSSLRHEPESFMPSSKSSNARSNATSPFSSSLTIVSNRWSHSSDFAKRLNLLRLFYAQIAKMQHKHYAKLRHNLPKNTYLIVPKPVWQG